MITNQQRRMEMTDVLESLRKKAELAGTPWSGYQILGLPTTEDEYNSAVTFEVPAEKPAWGQVQMEWDIVAQVFANEKYKYQRGSAYPTIQEQLDMQYHDAINGTTTWQDAIAAVKEAYPKPE